MSDYQLTYFRIRGRAMHIRYLCLDNCLKLIVHFVDVTGDWPKIKRTTTFGQLPVFKDGDFELVQSNAILRYLARKHGLYGSNDKEASLIDMINDQQEDVRSAYVRMIYNNYDEGKAPFIASLATSLPLFEKVLTSNNGGQGFFVGSKISFVDYTVFDLLDNLQTLSPGVLDAYPHLKSFHARMSARPPIASYRQSDEFIKMPINGNGKQ
jgi:glutathione S-transferase